MSGAYCLLFKTICIAHYSWEISITQTRHVEAFSWVHCFLFEYVATYFRQESHNIAWDGSVYPTTPNLFYASLDSALRWPWLGIFLTSCTLPTYELTRLIFHRSSTSTMRSSFELRDERAPCKKTRLFVRLLSKWGPLTVWGIPPVCRRKLDSNQRLSLLEDRPQYTSLRHVRTVITDSLATRWRN